MIRPSVSVVMPFAGDAAAARAALASLLALDTRPEDELILADNSGGAPGAAGVTVVSVPGERSPAHARNVGAEHAHHAWILFLDADCRAPRTLLDAFFAVPVADDVGALAGEVIASPDADTLAGRYGAARSFLSQRAHLQHPFRPRAVAANLLVRQAAFAEIGGFYEGVRAAEDTDFSWRLQAAGWRLEPRWGAEVEHRYRTSLTELRRQWRGYAAGRAWLARRYDGFVPEPAVRRGAGRVLARIGRRGGRGGGGGSGGDCGGARRGAGPDAAGAHLGRRERGEHLLIDVLLAGEELAGLALSNRPEARRAGSARTVLVADRFPERGDPFGELAGTLEGARIEAAARPESPDQTLARELEIYYREDDGFAARWLATLAILIRHPLRCASDLARHRHAQPSLVALAPAARRVQRDAGAPVQAIGGAGAQSVAERIAGLAGRRLRRS
jgi:GT2 family glycosyltransferase